MATQWSKQARIPGSWDYFYRPWSSCMGQRYLSPQLNDGLHQLTSVQILGKIFIGSVYILASANLNTRGGASSRPSLFCNHKLHQDPWMGHFEKDYKGTQRLEEGQE